MWKDIDVNYYTQILHTWNWEDISKAMNEIADEYRKLNLAPEDGFNKRVNGISLWAGIPANWDDDNYFAVMLYIGSSLNIIPSGKFYMPWSTNVTEKEAEKDTAFMNAFEKVAAKFNMYQQSGEGDPLDWYLCRSYEIETEGTYDYEAEKFSPIFPR